MYKNMNKRRLYESIMQNVAKCVKRALNEYEYKSGKVLNDGNGRVGGAWASATYDGRYNILDDFLNKFEELTENYIDDAEFKEFETYCCDNEDAFELIAKIHWGYDDNVGMGEDWDLDEIVNEKQIRDFVQEFNFENEQIREFALQALDDTVNEVEIDKFDIEDDMSDELDYERDYDEW